jgi:probable HAF family extracellular repeat protein
VFIVFRWLSCFFCAALLAGLLFLPEGLSAGSAAYSVLYLGQLLNNGSTVPRGLHRCAEVVGDSGFVDGVQTRGFVWIKSRGMRSLGTLPDSDYSVASAINAHGFIAGYSNAITAVRAVSWVPDGSIRELPIPAGDTGSEALAINSSGTIVGMSSGPHGTRAVLWSSKEVVPLSGLPTTVYSQALAINDAGEVAGIFGETGRTHAFLWSPDHGLRDLGTLPGDRSSMALDVNNAGEVVGSSSGPRGTHAVLWTKNGQIRDLGALPGGTESVAIAINDSGQVVGNSGNAGENRPFLWTRRRGLVDLNQALPRSATMTLTAAFDINSRGQIIAYGRPRNPHARPSALHHSNVALAYLLTPAGAAITASNDACRLEPSARRSSAAGREGATPVSRRLPNPPRTKAKEDRGGA